MKIKHQRVDIPFPVQAYPYPDLIDNEAYCLFESSEIDAQNQRVSLLGFDPIFEVVSGRDQLSLRLTNRAFRPLFCDLVAMFDKKEDTKLCDDSVTIFFPREAFQEEEDQRFRQNIPARILPQILKLLPNNSGFCGLYGAFAHTFVYQFEEVKEHKTPESPDFRFFLFSKILVCNHLTQTCFIDSLLPSGEKLEPKFTHPKTYEIPESKSEFTVGAPVISPEDEIFKSLILESKTLFEKGELMELVLSRKLESKFHGEPSLLYQKYAENNPSPYQFYIDFKDEVLLGASPEIMVKLEKGKLELKPISGTVPRTGSPIEDHERLLELLNSTKEKAELDMLIDLGRNDLSKVCKPGIQIDEYRKVESYKHLFHTVARLSGDLEEGRDGLDALGACLNAGTLTGAPKYAALNKIEEMEPHSRGYYGGCIGYLLPNGDVNTAITIRSCHLKDGRLKYLAGATLLMDSDPESELRETEHKMAAFVESLKEFQDA